MYGRVSKEILGGEFLQYLTRGICLHVDFMNSLCILLMHFKELLILTDFS